MATKNPPFTVKAIYDYKSDYEDDLNFPAGQLITVIAVEDDEWFSGSYVGVNGAEQSGMFPKNFVQTVSESISAAKSEPSPGLKESEDAGVLKDQDEKPQSTETNPSIAKADTPEEPVVLKEEVDKEQLEHAIKENKQETAAESKESAQFTPKGLSSRISTFDSEKPPLPGTKKEPGPYNQSLKGVASSYIPPSLGSNKQQSSKSKPDFSHSSYVPPPLKKDTPKSSAVEQPKTDFQPEVVKPTTSFREESHEEEGPKLSLKERIALLQQKQKEEAEREAEAQRKKQEKKETQKKAAAVAPPVPSETEIDPSSEPAAHEPHLHAAPDEDQAIPGEFQDVVDSDEVEEAEEHQERNVEEEGGEEADEDEDEEDEDSEEARRAALRDRMAKLSGAGMYGGFNPFAAPGGGIPPKKTSTKSKSAPKEQEHAPQAAPIPIIPFGGQGGAPKLPEALQRKNTTTSIADTEGGKDLDTEALEDEEAETEKGEEIDVEDDLKQKSPISTTVPGIASLQEAPAVPRRVSEAAGDNESFQSAHESPSEQKFPEGSALGDTPEHKNFNTESAVEGDDEAEKISSDEGITLSDREKERREKFVPHLIDPNIDPASSQLASDYTTGYESDDDVQLPVEKDEPAVSAPSAPPPPPTGSTDPSSQVPFHSLSIDDDSTVSETSRSVPPVPSVPSVPPIDSSLGSGAKISDIPQPKAPPPPPVVPEATSDHGSEAHVVPILPSREKAAPPPPPSVPAPSFDKEQEFTPTKPVRRSSSIHSARSQRSFRDPPPIPQSPIDANGSPQLPSSGPPGIGIKTASTFDSFGSTNSSVPSPTVRRTSTLPTITDPESARDSVSSAVSRGDFKLDISSGWWLRKDELPPKLQSRAGKDLIFEVDEHVVNRRGGKQLVLKDYYILNQDNSQIILHVVFDPADPQNTVSVSETLENPPDADKLELDKYSTTFGTQVFQIANRLLNQSVKEPLVPLVLSQIKDILRPIGLRSYGAVIYSNSNNTEVHQSEDFKPGDVIAINKAKFQGHNKLHQKIVYDVGNSGSPFAAIVTEYDENKRKFRVIEADGNGKVRHASYKPSDMKSGKIKVFRVVGRDYVKWD